MQKNNYAVSAGVFFPIGKSLFTLFLLSLSLWISPVQASTWVWLDGDWDCDGAWCWDLWDSPSDGEDVYIVDWGFYGAKTVTYDFGGDYPILNNLYINTNWGGTTTLKQTYNTMHVNNVQVGADGSGTYQLLGGHHQIDSSMTVGYLAGSDGTYVINGGSVNANREYIGYNGTGLLTQINHTNTVDDDLFVGLNTSGNGRYELSGSGNLTVQDDERIGYYGTGTFKQSGGTHTITDELALGYYNGSSGTFDMSGGTLNSNTITVGRDGDGTFNQSGGTNNITGNLHLGRYANGNGTYTLSGGSLTTDTIVGGAGNSTLNYYGGTLNTGDISVGNFRMGNASYSLSTGNFTAGTERIGSNLDFSDYTINSVFSQSGGTHDYGVLTLGYWGSYFNFGRYDLGSGTVTGTTAHIGFGLFEQTGGTHTLDALYTGGSSYIFGFPDQLEFDGTYRLIDGDLTVANEYHGNGGDGGFVQSGGDHTVLGELKIGNSYDDDSYGGYLLSGGNLTTSQTIIGAGYYAIGKFTQTGGSHTATDVLALGEGDAYELIDGELTVNNLHIANGELNSAHFIQRGGAHTVTGEMLLGAGEDSFGYYHLLAGTLDAESITEFSYSGGSNDAYGILYLDGGTLHSDNIEISIIFIGSESGLTGSHTMNTGDLVKTSMTVGRYGTGSFIQNGGDYSGGLMLGVRNGSSGSYELNAGNLSVYHEYLGVEGVASFTQRGGTHTITDYLDMSYNNNGQSSDYYLHGGTLTTNAIVTGTGLSSFYLDGGSLNVQDIDLTLFVVGGFAGSNGSYTLNADGQSSSMHLYVGGSGAGYFTQNGGLNTVSDNLYLGELSSGIGHYDQTAGELWANRQVIGGGGIGLFTQSGGSNTVNYQLILGSSAGATGEYELQDGDLSVREEVIGHRGSGIVTQTGGNHRVTDSMILASEPGSSGTYNLTGGSLIASSINAENAGANFNFDGGRLQVNSFTGDLLNAGGVLAPGNSPGITTIDGDYQQMVMATLEIEIGGLLAGDEYDMLDVLGIAMLAGILEVNLIDPGSGIFAPGLGDSFDILTADSITGGFDSLLLASLGEGLSWELNFLVDEIGSLDVARLSIVNSAVPIPPAVWLFSSGLLGLVVVARRSNA